MYGHTLNGLIKNGIRLSYSKNPLGVRSPSMSNGSGVGNLSSMPGFGLHDLPPGRHASVDNGRFGSGKSSFYVDSNAPPRRQQLREESMQDNRVISNPFDGSVIGPRATRQMSLGSGAGVSSLGDFVNSGGLGAVPEHTFGVNGGLSNGSFMPSATSPPPRLAPRYFSAAPVDAIGTRLALSPILSPGAGSASSTFSNNLSGFGGGIYNSADIVPPPQQSQPAPTRSSFSPFRNDVFGGSDQHFDDRGFERNDSFIGHFGGVQDGGLSSTLYSSNTFAPLGSNGNGEQR